MMKIILSINPLTAMNFLIETVLSPRHKVILAPDVIMGMQILRARSSVDVIIVDVDDVNPDGQEFLYHVRNSRLYSDCTLISLKSQHDSEKKQEAAGYIDRIFYKPFSPEQLIDYVNNLPKGKSVSF